MENALPASERKISKRTAPSIFIIGKENETREMGWYIRSRNLPGESFLTGATGGIKDKVKVELNVTEARDLAAKLEKLAEAEGKFDALLTEYAQA